VDSAIFETKQADFKGPKCLEVAGLGAGCYEHVYIFVGVECSLGHCWVVMLRIMGPEIAVGCVYELSAVI
jgi:hypothetical protein